MKATQTEIEYHLLIQSQDSLALSKLYDKYGELIMGKLSRHYPKIAMKDESVILDAVNQAFFGYYKNPTTFNPQLSSLHRFLEIAAERDLKNIIQKEAKHNNKQNLPEDVELENNFWNRIQKQEEDGESKLIFKETAHLLEVILAEHFDESADRDIAKMILAGERETKPYAQVLKLSDEPTDIQKAEVKRAKDRIKKVLERNNITAKIKEIIR
ncbi:hypothetical protein [Hufsiella ginkgonis]|uniref:Uncharacterized protein n=1 Tax=Hufsiella ginkgonis TaxID=2695274 RepID=A0A7K1XTJ9_9SPHI|nr:hypothetical protein [Hufsiella ginkgonis]MXV14341.1 hypothetical protein [Hufsiella ginkgonis]